jgi:hypothetical protein
MGVGFARAVQTRVQTSNLSIESALDVGCFVGEADPLLVA